MAEYEKKVRAILKQNGFKFLRHAKGDHDIWNNTKQENKLLLTAKLNRVIG